MSKQLSLWLFSFWRLSLDNIVQRGERRLYNKEMKFNFKKISALATSALMIGMTAGIAAAANYPAPFVQSGASNVAIVVGSAADALDGIQASAINNDLHSRIGGASTSSTSSSVSGEAYALFTSASKIYLNSSISSGLSSGETTITKSYLPTVLADGDFDGDVSTVITQLITLKTGPLLKFAQLPTDDEDPVIGFDIGESADSDPIYNMTILFDQAVNFTSSDTIGESMVVFGKQYTVGAGTTTTKLYLYESSETVDLSIGGDDPSSATVTVGTATYTIDLVSASDTDATIKVTDSSGASQTKTISEDASKKVQGIDVAVNLADETTNYGLKAQITVGANKVMLQDGSRIKVGSDETGVDGTLVYRTGTDWSASTGFTIAVAAEDGDSDAILQGESFVDPVFGTFKIDFSTVQNAGNTESIKVEPSGTGKVTIEFTNHEGNTKNFIFFNNDSVTARLADTTSDDDIKIREMDQVNVSQYVMLGNEETGYLLELTDVDNDTDGTADTVEFKDVFSGDSIKAAITSEGQAQLTVGGKSHTLYYYDASTSAQRYVRIDDAETSTAGYVSMFPTIKTSKGAKVAFYEPTTVDLNNWGGSDSTTDVSRMYFPDGDGFTYITFTLHNQTANWAEWNVSNEAGTVLSTINTTDSTETVDAPIGRLVYHVDGSGTTNQTTIYLEDVGGTAISIPAVVIFEEQDKSASQVYNAMIVKLDTYTISTDKAGADTVEYTWGHTFADGATFGGIQLKSDDDIYHSMDYWGVKTIIDKSDTDQYKVEILYPDQQVNAEVYIAEESAAITPGDDGSPVSPYNGLVVLDSEVASQSSKNLIIVGGSCINTAAAALVGGSYCGADWTTNTEVGPGQFLIKGYAAGDQTLTSKLALLVAGYNKEDTVNAAKYLMTQTVDTSKAYKGTSSTSAEMVVETTTE